MKIVIATGIFPPQIGGPASHLFTLVKELVRKGVSVTVITYGAAHKIKGSQIVSIRRSPWRYLQYVIALLKHSGDADILYAQDLISSGLPTVFANVFLRKPLLIRLGGDFMWEQAVARGWTNVPLLEYYDEPKNKRERVYDFIYKIVLNAATYILFNSPLLLDEYQKRYKLSSSQCGLISNFIENDRVPGINAKSNEIVYAGRFITVKNLHNFIAAIQEISTDKHFVFIGGGPSEPSLKEHAHGRVTFVPTLGKDELVKRLQKSYLTVLPSLSEVCPNFVYESLLNGCPVIVTAENGLPADWKEYLIQFDPQSIGEIRSVIESLLERNTYEQYKKTLQAIPIKKNVDAVVNEYLRIFDTLTLKGG